MDEKTLIKKAKTELTKEGGYAWSGSTWVDVFGIFDVIYLSPKGRTSYFQVSTMDHEWERKNKIETFKIKNHTMLPPRSYLMLWDYRIADFIYFEV